MINSMPGSSDPRGESALTREKALSIINDPEKAFDYLGWPRVDQKIDAIVKPLTPEDIKQVINHHVATRNDHVEHITEEGDVVTKGGSIDHGTWIDNLIEGGLRALPSEPGNDDFFLDLADKVTDHEHFSLYQQFAALDKVVDQTKVKAFVDKLKVEKRSINDNVLMKLGLQNDPNYSQNE